ncbi:TMCO4 family protein [Abortiporus biennis]
MSQVEETTDLTKLVPSTKLDEASRLTIFQHFSRKLASHRNTAILYSELEQFASSENLESHHAFVVEINKWAEELHRNAWDACQEPGGGSYPGFNSLADTSTRDLSPLPNPDLVSSLLRSVLFLHITTSKQYHSHSRAFLFSWSVPIEESVIVSTLKDPEHAIEEAQQKTQSAKDTHASQGQMLRNVGIGVGAVAGGVLIGISGGLAAPLVGAGVTSILGFLGVGGTAAGLLATGLASSSIVCGALFGAYGSKKSAEVIERCTREVRDLAIVPVRPPADTLATVFGGDDTFALQWEVDALIQLSNALVALVKSQAVKYVKAQIIKRTVLAALFAALSPTAWLKIAQIIDNPWANAKSLAHKTGKVLGTLLAQRVLGNRPITLVGYSLGSLVIFEALQYLATLPPSETVHLIQDVYLFGSPIPSNQRPWTAARRVIAGRLVNGYGKDDYILTLLSRMSDMSWDVAGLGPVDVQGVENVLCDVDGHLRWRSMIGKSLEKCGVRDIMEAEVKLQVEVEGKKVEETMNLAPDDVNTVLREGPEFTAPS